MKNNLTKNFQRVVVLLFLLLVIRTFAKQNRIFPLDLSFVGNLVAQLEDLSQDEQAESLIPTELRNQLRENPLAAGDSVVGDALAIDYIQVQGSDLGCSQIINPYARGDVPPDNIRGGDRAKIQSLYQANFPVSLQEKDRQFFIVANGREIAEAYCFRPEVNGVQRIVILSQQDNSTYLVVEFKENQYTGKTERHESAKQLHS